MGRLLMASRQALADADQQLYVGEIEDADPACLASLCDGVAHLALVHLVELDRGQPQSHDSTPPTWRLVRNLVRACR